MPSFQTNACTSCINGTIADGGPKGEAYASNKPTGQIRSKTIKNTETFVHDCDEYPFDEVAADKRVARADIVRVW